MELVKILYCNLRDRETIKGHRHFDARWANLLSAFAKVEIISPARDWYTGLAKDIKVTQFDSETLCEQKKIVNLGLWKKGILRHLAVKSHTNNFMKINFLLQLDRREKYDYIIVSTYDIFVFPYLVHKISNSQRIFIITHNVEAYTKRIYKFIYRTYMNKVNHFVMEKDMVLYMQSLYHTEKNRIHYMPHMLNKVVPDVKNHYPVYDIVGISNTNSANQIKELLKFESETHFYENHKIKILLRSGELEADAGSIKVIKGKVNMLFEEYYWYVSHAGILYLPFPADEDFHTSGTIIDAFSQGIPVIGTDCKIMRQYNRLFPRICRTYKTMEEMAVHVVDLFYNHGVFKDDYDSFCKERTDDALICKLKSILC